MLGIKRSCICNPLSVAMDFTRKTGFWKWLPYIEMAVP